MLLLGMDNNIAVLEHSNRVCDVNLRLAGWQLEEVLGPMQVSFPELTDLRHFSGDETLRDIPEAMAVVVPLSVLSCLESLNLQFQSPQSRPDWESQSPPGLDALSSPLSGDFTPKALPNI
jgi:hypothetical protein